MTQLFIGHKPGVGPVLKVLRYDTDDPLTLPNAAYDRYYFNSENQHLSYVFTAEPFYFRAADIAALPTDFDLYGYWISGHYGNSSSWKLTDVFLRVSNRFSEFGYPPIPEIREKDLNTGRVSAGRRRLTMIYDTLSKEAGYVEHYQYKYQMMRVDSYASSSWQTVPLTYQGKLISAYSRIGIGEWVVPIVSQYVYNDNRNQMVTYPQVWDLPADSSPMRTYTYAGGLLGLEINQSRVALARPGYDVNASGLHTKIIDSNRAPALCIMAGEVTNVAADSSVTLYPPPGITISDTAVTEFMYRRVGDPWFVPGFIAAGYVRSTRFDLSYSVASNAVTIHNEGTDPVDIRYVVFNTDRSGTSSGGNQIMFRGNDGSRDYVQIKKPGTSDPASKPNDILLDTRFPSFQIISEGYIPLSSFSDAPSGEHQLRGKKKYTVSFTNNGFIPYLKFMIVFPNCVTTPYVNMAYNYKGTPTWGPPSNASVLAQVDNSQITFWASPGNWSRYENDEGALKYRYDIPDPIGVRYYVFGIAQ